MLIAYLDEFGHVGPYIGPEHPKFKTHPVFGYAGFVMPSHNVRTFGGFFEHVKESLLAWEIEQSGKHPRRWEKKGASLLTTQNVERYVEVTHSVRRLLTRLKALDGRVIYYGQVKPTGSEKETGESASDRNAHHLRQILARLSRYANDRDSDVMVVLDSTDDRPRLAAVEAMASFIYAPSSPPEVKRIVEAPMQVESHLYGTIQFADWLCALLGRLSHYEYVEGSQFDWAPDRFGQQLLSVCADQSKIHHPNPDVRDIYSKTLCDKQDQSTRGRKSPSSAPVSTKEPRPLRNTIGSRFPDLMNRLN